MDSNLQIQIKRERTINAALMAENAKLKKGYEEVINILAPCGYREVIQIMKSKLEEEGESDE